jgi:hypothetical protein
VGIWDDPSVLLSLSLPSVLLIPFLLTIQESVLVDGTTAAPVDAFAEYAYRQAAGGFQADLATS